MNAIDTTTTTTTTTTNVTAAQNHNNENGISPEHHLQEMECEEQNSRDSTTDEQKQNVIDLTIEGAELETINDDDDEDDDGAAVDDDAAAADEDVDYEEIIQCEEVYSKDVYEEVPAHQIEIESVIVSDIEEEEQPETVVVQELNTEFINNSINAITQVMNRFIENDPDTIRSQKARRDVLKAINCYQEILRDRKRQSGIKAYILKRQKMSEGPSVV